VERRRIVILTVAILGGGLVALGAVTLARMPRGAPLDRDGVRVVVESELQADGTLHAGRLARASDGADPEASFANVRDLVRRAEWNIAPVIVIHHSPRLSAGTTLRGPATHTASGGLLLPGGRTPNETVLAHELTHVAIHERRRRADAGDVTGRRVVAVIDEGVADFAASVATGAHVIGDPSLGPVRDLEKAPHVSVEGWAQLAGDRSFDPHPLGWDLASALFARARASKELRDDATIAAASASGASIHDVLVSFVERCPERSRATLRTAVNDWVPEELAVK
jgi:hypothetical protein